MLELILCMSIVSFLLYLRTSPTIEPNTLMRISREVKIVMAGGSNQNLRLFIRGKAMSTQLAITGIIQLPKEPNAIGITSIKIIINA